MEACLWPSQTRRNQAPKCRIERNARLHQQTTQVPCNKACLIWLWARHRQGLAQSCLVSLGPLTCEISRSRKVLESSTRLKARLKALNHSKRWNWHADSKDPRPSRDRISWLSPPAAACLVQSTDTSHHQRSIQKWSTGDSVFHTSWRILKCACFSGCGRCALRSEPSCDGSSPLTWQPHSRLSSFFGPRHPQIMNRVWTYFVHNGVFAAANLLVDVEVVH